MATRSSSPLVVLAPTNSLKRALSEDQDSDDASHPDPKKIKLKQGNTPQKDKKKRKKKKKKTPVVLELPTSTNAAPPSTHTQVEPLTPTALRTPMDSGKGKRKETSGPALQLEGSAGHHSGEDAGRLSDAAESSSAARARSPSPGAEQESAEVSEDRESQSATIARLNDELKAQSILLKKHEATLSQFTQSLTCQVCLDLLHKPFALAPCGHVACYNCLVAWFTSEPEEHYMGPRKKTCPDCRATIKERPVEVWNIKELVTGLLKSGLVSGLSAGPSASPPLPGPPQPADTPPDPWHNIFRYPHQHPMFHPPPLNGQEPPSVEDMGMLDAEDGVYRCLDCMHEIWDGVCTSCQREYRGHIIDDGDDGEMFGDSDGDGDEEPIFWPHFLQAGLAAPIGPWWNVDDSDEDEDESELERAIQDAEDGYDSFIDDDDEVEDVHRAAAIIEINDSDDERGNSSPPATRRRGAAPVNSRIVISSDEEDEDIPDPPSRRRRNRNRISSPAENEVIVVSGDESDDGDATSRHSQSTINDDDDEDEDESRASSDNEFHATSSTYNRGTAPMTAGDLMHLIQRFQDGDGDSQDGSSRGYQSDDYY
ncbi:RING-type domain-containing protein [Mycena sanguinolenta]|uniref:RING-type domain-containing protein n=1 Tax=Mycena sanguinolenta TaxID=230812 RepID=A0A8H6YWX1_9AGAR|nr:RING-type domain-containing protein [Mycena sanguinolenta]